jgi:hypothetical protein
MQAFVTPLAGSNRRPTAQTRRLGSAPIRHAPHPPGEVTTHGVATVEASPFVKVAQVAAYGPRVDSVMTGGERCSAE